MRRFGLTSILCVLGLMLALGVLPVKANYGRAVMAANAAVQLNEAQKQELAALHQEILENKKEVVAKYIEYGVISPEKGEKIICRLEKRYAKLESNGFIPFWGKCLTEKPA